MRQDSDGCDSVPIDDDYEEDDNGFTLDEKLLEFPLEDGNNEPNKPYADSKASKTPIASANEDK